MDDIIKESDYSNTKTSYTVELNSFCTKESLMCDTKIERSVMNLPKRKQQFIEQKTYQTQISPLHRDMLEHRQRQSLLRQQNPSNYRYNDLTLLWEEITPTT